MMDRETERMVLAGSEDDEESGKVVTASVLRSSPVRMRLSISTKETCICFMEAFLVVSILMLSMLLYVFFRLTVVVEQLERQVAIMYVVQNG